MLNFIERIVALVLLVLMSPICFVVSILIKLESKGPVIFKQHRVGKDSKLFYIYKFRTMRNDAPKDSPTHAIDGDSYITKLGRVLRKTSLDEIPQLVNIVRGDMSFVGPRPVIPNEKRLVKLRKMNGVDKVLPGITGWAQINGRDKLSVNKKVAYDLEYVKNKSLVFDMYIVALTVVRVIRKEDIIEGCTSNVDSHIVSKKSKEESKNIVVTATH